MTKKKPLKFSEQEERLIEQLRGQPELMERFKAILEISKSKDGRVKSADEVEGLLIQEVRLLGKTTLESWATGAEKSLGEQLKGKDASAGVRKKKR